MTDSHAERRAALIAACLAVPLIAITVLVAVRFGPLMSFDNRVVQSWYAAVSGTGWLDVLHGFAAATDPWVVRGLLVAIALWALLLRHSRRTALWIIATLLAGDAVWIATKQLMQRPRPDVPDQIGGWSYPSGHATMIAVGVGVVSVLTWQHVRGRRLRLGLVTAWVTIGLAVGADRILVGAHFPTDVVGGYLAGSLVVFAGCLLFGVVSTETERLDVPPLSSLPEHRRAVAIVLNPTKVADADAFRGRVSRAARAAGWDEPVGFETTIDDAGQSMTRAAVAAGADVVVAAGGDGTVRVVCAEMAASGIPVGIIPTGTGNLLARNLGVPLTEELALDTVFNGQDRAVDLVGVDGDGMDSTRFAVMAGMGLDAAIMDLAPDRLKKHMGWSAYFVAGATQLRYPAIRVEVSVDGQPVIQRRVRTVVIGNVGSLTAGIPLLPDARIDDGVLDVVVVAPRQVLGWVSLVWRVVTKRPRTDERLDRLTGKTVSIKAASPAPRQLDGDTVGPGRELRAAIEAGVLLVRVPR